MSSDKSPTNQPNTPIAAAQEFMRGSDIAGWLTRDYRYTNPVFEAALGTRVENLTRPVWLYIPAIGDAVLLAHDVDAGRFLEKSPRVIRYGSRQSMIDMLRAALPSNGKVAMEYSPMCELPRVSRVDAGSIELVRSLGVEVVSSGDVMQYATERWTPEQVASHYYAAESLVRTVKDACAFIGENARWKLREHDVAEFIRGRFDRLGLVTTDGPVVAFNEHSSDPHYEPVAGKDSVIRRNGWLLIDLWAKQKGMPDSVYADLTWVASLGGQPSAAQAGVFRAVKDARDAAFDHLQTRVRRGDHPQGWELDRIARTTVSKAGFGDYFVHRLGHSLGREVHSNAVNLDDWETRDTRQVIDGIGITIEPGVYLPEFGVRLEMDVYMSPSGPEITAEKQTDVIVIEVG